MRRSVRAEPPSGSMRAVLPNGSMPHLQHLRPVQSCCAAVVASAVIAAVVASSACSTLPGRGPEGLGLPRPFENFRHSGADDVLFADD